MIHGYLNPVMLRANRFTLTPAPSVRMVSWYALGRADIEGIFYFASVPGLFKANERCMLIQYQAAFMLQSLY